MKPYMGEDETTQDTTMIYTLYYWRHQTLHTFEGASVNRLREFLDNNDYGGSGWGIGECITDQNGIVVADLKHEFYTGHGPSRVGGVR